MGFQPRRAPTANVARTDAIAVEGFGAAEDRAEAYLEAGADVLFIEAPQDRAQLEHIAARFSKRIPLLANMVEGGATPITSADDLEDLGFSIVIFPGGIVRAIARTAQDYYQSLAKHGSNKPFGERMFDFDGLNAVIGTADMLKKGARYYGSNG